MVHPSAVALIAGEVRPSLQELEEETLAIRPDVVALLREAKKRQQCFIIRYAGLKAADQQSDVINLQF
jgi:hypothetical protein